MLHKITRAKKNADDRRLMLEKKMQGVGYQNTKAWKFNNGFHYKLERKNYITKAFRSRNLIKSKFYYILLKII